MSNHVVTYTIAPFGSRYKCVILVDGYGIEKNYFYHMRDAEAWCQRQVEYLKTQLA